MAMTMHDNGTKADELAHWRAFLATLPECSYLAMYLHGSEAMLEDAMRLDMSTELIPALRRARCEAQEAVREVLAQKAKLQTDVAELRGEVSVLRRVAVTIRDDAADAKRAIASLLRDAENLHARAVNAVVRL